MEIVNSLNMYSSIGIILNNLIKEENIREKISNLFNEALFRFSLPRSSENLILSKAILSYLTGLYIPLNLENILANRDVNPMEDENRILLILLNEYYARQICTEKEFNKAIRCLNIKSEEPEKLENLKNLYKKFLENILY